MDIIRKFYAPDLKSVMKIWYDSNLEVHDFIDASYWERNYGYVSRLIPKVEVYVYEVDGKVVGFIGFDKGYVQGIFVQAEYRGFGIGARLLNYIKENNDYFTLHVFEQNKEAVLFYEKMGLRKQRTEVNEDLGEVEYYMYYCRPKEEE
jgi:putative acetyltransferase